MFLIHLLAWPWGSIISGHRRALSTIIPLSTENESTGRPAMFHARILTGLPRVEFRENDSEQGIFFTLHCSTQPDIQSYMTKEEKTTQISSDWRTKVTSLVSTITLFTGAVYKSGFTLRFLTSENKWWEIYECMQQARMYELQSLISIEPWLIYVKASQPNTTVTRFAFPVPWCRLPLYISSSDSFVALSPCDGCLFWLELSGLVTKEVPLD